MNFNPAGAAYAGVTDSDTSDSYPSEIVGLVHVKGTVVMEQNALVRGALISESGALADAVNIRGNSSVVHVPTLTTNPPMGYTSAVTMSAQRGSFRQVVVP